MNRLELKLELIRLYRRWIDGDQSVRERALEIRRILRSDEKSPEPKRSSEDIKETKILEVRGEIRGGEVIEHKALVKQDDKLEVVDLKEKKTLFSDILGEEIVKREEQIEEREVELDTDVATRVESPEELIEEEEEQKSIQVDERDTKLESIIEDREKEELIERILNSTPKKVPEAPEQTPVKRELPEEEAKKIPERHRSRFDVLMSFISQIFKVFKR
ncbi:MAG: hypothetical protein N3C61_01675 [Candidatus Micrarchaeota archaeon]|nr:hypothetical protein [Candidatus Micrarchaeota archaeon]